ncbi:hypothetical protein BCI9360_00898 [Bacillus sp. CECT 9360]|nr:hypothetical protein BCI9360_00898 [Bacillus sp. CECT 9360]
MYYAKGFNHHIAAQNGSWWRFESLPYLSSPLPLPLIEDVLKIESETLCKPHVRDAPYLNLFWNEVSSKRHSVQMVVTVRWKKRGLHPITYQY